MPVRFMDAERSARLIPIWYGSQHKQRGKFIAAAERREQADLLTLDYRLTRTLRDKATAERIAAEVLAAHPHSGFVVRDLWQKWKWHRLSALRYLVWKRMRARGYPLTRIADAFGLDHTTVLHGIRRPDDVVARMLRQPLTKNGERVLL